jgi:hypothetical protein
MSGNFKMDDYVDVAERVREFSSKFPDGSLQSELTRLEGGWLCKAYAYRNQDDARPGIGHAFEPVPGKTPYTKDSEAMNAETSAWGRAIVALGFDTKKIASRQEVRAREGSAPQAVESKSGPVESSPQQDSRAASPFQAPADALGLQASRADAAPDDGGEPSAVRVHFGKNAGSTLGELTAKQRSWYAETWTPDGKFPVKPEDRRLRQAARILCGVTPVKEVGGPFDPDGDVPF